MGNISNKVTIPALAGAIVTIATWAIMQFAHITIPGEIAAAITTVVMAGLGYVVPHGGDT
jgi:hypothetical protein